MLTNLHWRDRTRQARRQAAEGAQGAVGKAAVIDAKEGSGKIRVGAIEKTDTATPKGFVVSDIEAAATVFTDEHRGYRSLSASFGHRVVRRSIGQYVAHTDGIESFSSKLQRGYIGTYHKMGGKHLSRYVIECAERQDVCDLDTITQTAMLAKGRYGKQPRYNDLVADHG